MKTQVFSIATLALFLTSFSFAQTQRLELSAENEVLKREKVRYCGMVYHDDSTKTKAPSSKVEVTSPKKEQSKKSLPTKSEKPAELRREG